MESIMSVTLVKPDPPVSEVSDDTEKIPAYDPRSALISIDPARVSGVACFAHSRVPLQILWDHLEEGISINEFLDGFDGVTREQATGVLRLALEKLLESLPESTPWR